MYSLHMTSMRSFRKEEKEETEKRPNDPTDKNEETAQLESETLETASDKATTTATKLKIAVVKPTRRSKPYPQSDDFLSLSKLTFSDETCQKKGCSCSQGPSSHKGMFLNYARSCVQSKYHISQPVVHQARFKLHNKHKDQKNVIRTARLKIHQAQPVGFGKSPVRASAAKENVFGGGHTKAKDMTFSALAASSSPSIKSKDGVCSASKPNVPYLGQAESFSGSSFEKHRSVSIVTPYSIQGRVLAEDAAPDAEKEAERPLAAAALDLSSLTASLPLSHSDTAVKREPCDVCPLHPRRCPRPCTCATQARLDPDDLSVDELACYFEDFVHIPKKMSTMAEMMYT